MQQRVSGRVAVGEKPDVLWDRPDLERLYARLEDEYELRERGETLNRKIAVISDTATTLSDIIDTKRVFEGWQPVADMGLLNQRFLAIGAIG